MGLRFGAVQRPKLAIAVIDGGAQRMRRLHGLSVVLTSAAAILMLSVMPSVAVAQESLAATCPGPRTANVLNGGADERFAQTFVPSETGPLTRAEIDYTEPAGKTAQILVQILAVDPSGTPNNTVLGQVTLPDPPDGSTGLVAVFATPPVVNTGQEYALALSRPGGGTLAINWGGRSDSSACAGHMFVQRTSGVWDTFGADAVYRVFVTTPPSPEPEPVPEPTPKADGTLTIDANKGKVEKGRKVTLSGQLDVAANESCEQNRPIQIQRRLKSQDDSKFATFETVSTDATGNFSTKEKVKKTYFYRAVVAETDACDDETSNSQKVRVQKKKAAQEA